MPNGREFQDFGEFKQAMLGQSDRLLKGFSEKMFVYAVGRGIESSDRTTIDGLVTTMKSNNNTIRSLVKAIVDTNAFRTK